MAARPLVPVGYAPDLIPGRECGECVECCVALTIREPRLKKPQGIPCRHLAAGGGCGIYEVRPKTCRTFYCAWRFLPWVKTDRPDRSRMLVMVRQRERPGGGREEVIALHMLDEGAAEAAGAPETVAAAISAGVTTQVEVPGPPGYTAGVAKVNALFADAIAAHDKPAMIELLRDCWERGQHGKRKKVR